MDNIKNNIEMQVTLEQREDLENYVKSKIDEWLEYRVIGLGAGWFHIHKTLDEIYINAEGYNTPPLTRLNFDIESLDPVLANRIGTLIYQYFKEAFGITSTSEYLTYDTFRSYSKTKNLEKNQQIVEDETREVTETVTEELVDYGDSFFNILNSLQVNGNCKVYPRYYSPERGQIVYAFSVDDNGRLKVEVSVNQYRFNPWVNEKNDVSTLDNPINSILISKGSVEDAIAAIFLNYQQYGNVVTSHKTTKKVDISLAVNEFYSYMEQMYLIFQNEDSKNWLEENNLLAQWVKSSNGGRLNILLNRVKPFEPSSQLLSYENMVGNLVPLTREFSFKIAPVLQEWNRIKNGEYDIIKSSHKK